MSPLLKKQSSTDITDIEEIISEDVTNLPAAIAIDGEPVDDGEVTGGPIAELYQWFGDRFQSFADDTTLAQNEIVRNILATSADDILNLRQSLDSASQWAHRKIIVRNVTSIRTSDFSDEKIYVTLAILTQDGEHDSISIGSPTMLAQLKVALENNLLQPRGWAVKIVPIRRNRKGRKPALYFRSWDYETPE